MTPRKAALSSPRDRGDRTEVSKRYYKKNKEARLAYQKARYPIVAAKERDRRLQRQYNISAEEYDQILEHQQGVCAICQRPPATKRLAVDHDHKTGLTRGLLCWTCNAALGKFNDREDLVRRALAYLEHPPVTEALGEERLGLTGRVTKKRKRRK